MGTWIENDTPKVAGYYLTIYWNEEKQDHLFKAFWYSPTYGWMFQRFVPKVIAYWDVRHEYYCPCQMQPDVSPYKPGNDLLNDHKAP